MITETRNPNKQRETLRTRCSWRTVEDAMKYITAAMFVLFVATLAQCTPIPGEFGPEFKCDAGADGAQPPDDACAPAEAGAP